MPPLPVSRPCLSSWLQPRPQNLQITLLDGLSLRAAAVQLQSSPMAVVSRDVRLPTLLAHKKALAGLRQQLVGAS